MEKKDNYPEHWKITTLGDVAPLKNGYAFKSKEYQETGIPVIRISDIKSEKVDTTYSVKIEPSGMLDSFTVLKEDILIAMSGATTGKFGIYKSSDKSYQNQRVGNLRSLDNNLLLQKFLFYFLNNLKKKIEEDAYGGAQPNISGKVINSYPFPLPPLNEQKRIVAKIEELFSELDAGEQSLRDARQQLTLYRQSLLKQAFEGKLTETWRQQNPDKLEDPKTLLARIQQERESRHQQQLQTWQQAVEQWEENGKEGKKPSKPRPLKKITSLDSHLLNKIKSCPDHWVWSKLGNMTTAVGYGSSAKSKTEGNYPVIRMGNMQGGAIDWGDLVYTSDTEEIAKYELLKGDVLFNRTNSPELVGKTVIYRGNYPAIFAGYLIRVNHINTITNGDYLNYFLNSQTAKQYGNTVKTDGVNQSNINGEKLSGYPFPYCSLPEQQEIVRLLDEQFTAIEQNEKEITHTLTQSQALRQSILKKAFSGKLTN